MDWKEKWHISEYGDYGTATLWGKSAYINLLPVDGSLKIGSLAICIDTGDAYTFDNEAKAWKAI